MFRKQVAVQQQRQCSGKDSKQLRRDVQVQFPFLDEESLAELLPPKAVFLTLKLSNRALAHSVDGAVLFFDPTGRKDILIPSVYALWKFPQLLPALHTYSPVSSKILGGADLFLQGVIVPGGESLQFGVGDLMAVKVAGNPLPFAVGTMEVSSEQAARAGMKGKGLKLIHHFGDQLWAIGDKSAPAGFTPTCILPQEDACISGEQTMEGLSISEPEAVSQLGQEEDKEAQQPVEEHGLERHDNSEATENSAADCSGSCSGPTLDEIFDASLLQGLHTLRPSELPIMTSDFYTKHMLPAKGDSGVAFDIKKTSYKKLSKLLQKFEKAGLIKLKVTFGKDYLSSVDRTHQLFRDGRQVHRARVQQESSSVQEQEPRFQLSYLYRFPSSLRPILGVKPPPKEALFSEQEVLNALQKYAESFQLCQDAGVVKLDPLLASNLFNKKEYVIVGNPHPVADLQKRLLSKLQLFHKAVRNSEQGERVEVVRKGSIKNIELRLDDRVGGRKHATKLSHVESFALQPEELAGALQRKFQTSCSMQKLPGKLETGQELVLQGSLVKEVTALLSTTYGIDAKFITATQKGK